MSLSAAEKVRVVQALDRLGVGFVEAGFPSSNPKEAELFRLLAEIELERAQVCAFGMTRRRGRRGRGGPGAARPGRLRGAGDHLRRQDLGAAPGEGDQGLARGEPGDDRRLGQLRPRRGQAGDLRRRALLRRLARRPRATRSSACGPRSPPGPRTSPSATPTAPASRARSREATAAVVAELGERVAGRDPRPQRRRVRGRQLARRGRGRGAAGAGHDQRLRRALRQREPGLDPARAAAQARLRVRARRIACGC